MSRSSYLHSHEYPPSMSPDGFFHLPISVLNETAPFPMPAAAHAAAFHVAPNAYSQEYYSHPIAAQVSGPLFVVDEAGGQQCGPRVHLPEAPVTIQISPACQAPEDANDEKAPPAPVDQEQLAALISARERDVKNLLATLAMPLASWDAKFLWHCTMNQTRNTEPEFMLKMKEIHKTFYVPPPIAFYALWLHQRFWTGSTELVKDVEARLPESFGVGMSKDARIGIFLYMLALLFSNKHLDDFSYRNSSWYEAAGVPASMFLQFEIIALRELGWNFKIPTEEWIEWIEYLQTSNSYLEHAHPTHGVYHRSVGDALRDACTAIYQMGAVSSNSSSSSIDSPPALIASPAPGFDEDVNGLYGYRQPLAQPAPAKYIPWDTSLDPVVHLESSRRRGSFSSLSSTSSYGLSGRSDWNGTNSPEDNVYGHAVWGDPSVEVVSGSVGPDYGSSYEGSQKRRSGNCGDDAFPKGRFEGHGLVANKYLGHASHRSESHVGAMKRPPLRTRTSSSPLKSYNRGPVDSWYSAVPNGIPAYL